MSNAASNSLKQTPEQPETTPQQVADYLISHPDFLEINSYLLTELTVKHQSGQSISLVERQVAALRQENQQLKQQLSTLIANAQQNDQLLEKSRRLVLKLIECNSSEDIRRQLESALMDEFTCSAAKLWLLDNKADEKTGQLSRTTAETELARFIGKKHPYCGLLREQEKHVLFTEQADKVGSAAVLPLYSENQVIGLLAIANADKNYYRENMSTSLLSYVGQVTTQLISTLK